MSAPDQPEIPPRSRFRNVVNRADVPVETWKPGRGRFHVTAREIALALPARDLGYSISTVEPGARSCPYHFHHLEEEVFFVLEGRGHLRQGDGQGDEELIELGPGDFVSFPPGTGIAHQFINPYEAPFTYLALSNRLAADVAEYPDSNKVYLRGKRMMLRRTPTLDYLDGED